VCEQLAQGYYVDTARLGVEPATFGVASPTPKATNVFAWCKYQRHDREQSVRKTIVNNTMNLHFNSSHHFANFKP